ncbi:hypothetical protein KHP62_15695 [Rhodobacteraceae bacterium NNCM2]|nr:hypothetical protein [Coraliihabitans acroporae]
MSKLDASTHRARQVGNKPARLHGGENDKAAANISILGDDKKSLDLKKFYRNRNKVRTKHGKAKRRISF